MKILDKYYYKIYKHTNRLLKKVFGLNVKEAMIENCSIKGEIEKLINKPIEMITMEDIIKNSLSYKYCKYKTLCNILSVISGAAFINSFCEDDIEEMKK